jgi:hypothetical protein
MYQNESRDRVERGGAVRYNQRRRGPESNRQDLLQSSEYKSGGPTTCPTSPIVKGPQACGLGLHHLRGRGGSGVLDTSEPFRF